MSSSAFDQAVLDEPLLNERCYKKKWSFANMFNHYKPMEDDEEEAVAPLMLSPQVSLVLPKLSPQVSLDSIKSMITSLTPQVSQELETIHFDDALIQERHGEIEEINASVKQIYSIQKDMADLVEAQDGDIQRMSWMAIESFDQTNSGLEQIIRAAKFSQGYQAAQRRRKFTMYGVLVVVLVTFMIRAHASNATATKKGSPLGQAATDDLYSLFDAAGDADAFHFPMIHVPGPP